MFQAIDESSLSSGISWDRRGLPTIFASFQTISGRWGTFTFYFLKKSDATSLELQKRRQRQPLSEGTDGESSLGQKSSGKNNEIFNRPHKKRQQKRAPPRDQPIIYDAEGKFARKKRTNQTVLSTIASDALKVVRDPGTGGEKQNRKKTLCARRVTTTTTTTSVEAK